MRAKELDFHLPPELIAQHPTARRSDSRLLHYRMRDRSIAHRTFVQFPSLLRPGDLLVFNNAKVLPARFMLQKITGGKVEGLFLRELTPGRWRVLLKSAGSARQLAFAADTSIQVQVLQTLADGEYEIQLSTDVPSTQLLARLGRMPLPPYIKRQKEHDPRDDTDRSHYQTIFASAPGSVAAPTAGLHFTSELLQQLDHLKIEQTQVTLHVGLGTFKPVTVDTLESHHMHTERYEITQLTADQLNRAEKERRRIIAIGTTSARVLESYPPKPWQPTTAETSIFIYPPYQWKRVGALLTNFHLPKSTLIALVAAMVGIEEQRRIYQQAIAEKYRFFSYGDAMFIE